MKNGLKVALVAALVTVGCHSKESLNREQQNYQVVQEGSASGATSTIGAPGEASIAQAPPITGTNADTTTAFTIAGNGMPPQVPTSTAPLMPPPNVGAGGATMPNYPIPPGLARNIGGSSTVASTNVRRTAPRETPQVPAAAPQQPMTSAVEPAATASAPSSTATTTPAETTASVPPASTETATPHKPDDKKVAPASAPAESETESSDEPAPEPPPATQTGTFWPR